MELSLDKNDQAVCKGCATEDSRPVLTTVRLGKGEIVAVDGFLLVRRPIESQQDDYFILAPARQVQAAKPIKSLGRIFIHDNTEGKITINSEQGSLVIPPVEGTYPNVEPLEDDARARTPQYRVAFTVSILKKLLTSIGDANVIEFKFHSPGSSIQFKAGDTHGLIIPLVIDKSTPE